MNPKILIASDLHLSEVIWTTRPEITGDSYFALDEIYRVAIEQRVGRVFLLGDVFDTYQPTARDVVKYQEFSNKLLAADIDLFYIEGQHDRSSVRVADDANHIAWCDTTKVANHADGMVVPINEEINAYCLDWRHSDHVAFELMKIPKNCQWLFAHQAWKELMSSSCRSDCSLEHDVPDHIQAVFTGDKHNHSICSIGARRLAVYSPGCTHMRKKNEPMSFAVFLVDDGRVRSIPIRSRPLRRFELMNLGSEMDVELALKTMSNEDIPEAVAKPLFIIQHIKELSNYIRSLRDRKDIHVITETVVPRLKEKQESQEKEKSLTSDVRADNTEELVKSLLHARIGHDEKLFNLAHFIIEHPQPRKLLDQMVEETEREIYAVDSAKVGELRMPQQVNT